MNEIQLSASGLYSAGYLAWPVKDGAGGVLYVSGDGICGGKTPCYSSLQTAMNAAQYGETIRVVQGTFDENPERSTTGEVIISGGWNSTFTFQVGTTDIRAPRVTGGGGVRLQPEIRVIAP